MLSRRRFIEVGVATSVAGAAIGVGQDAWAASSGAVFSSASWRALAGKKITLVDESGATQRVTVGAIAVAAAQAKTTGESFVVQLSGASTSIPDGLYRLRGGASGQVFLTGAGDGSATLAVNTVHFAS